MDHDVELVCNWFEGNAFQAGDRLPAERHLAASLGISRASLRRGLARLEARSLLRREVGRGTFVRTAAAGTTREVVGSEEPSLRLMPATSPREWLVARLALEPVLARMAAREGTGEAFARIESAEKHASQEADGPAAVAADRRFHHAIALAASNAPLLHCLDELTAAEERLLWGRLPRPLLTPADRNDTKGQHALIRSAILSRDVAAAGEAMGHHLSLEWSGLVRSLV